MKSNLCYINGDDDRKEVLQEVEKTAVYCELGHRDTLRLRLLAEELTGMTAKIIGRYDASFWVEAKKKNFELHLYLEMKLSSQDRQQILSLVQKTAPAQPSGIMDRIRLFFEHCVSSYEETGAYCASNGVNMGTMGEMYSSSTMDGSAITWSLNKYTETLQKEENPQATDDLEQSIVASLADDILVKVKEGRTEIIVKYHETSPEMGGGRPE